MKKKVAILYSGAKTWGGVETYLFNLLEEKNESVPLRVKYFSWANA